MEKKISIITPSLNQGAYIENNIQSILNQNLTCIEHLIIDGGSEDNTLTIINNYRDRIQYFVSEPDSGQSHAINKGIKVATGSIINWLNADDFYERNALITVLEAFKDQKTRVVCGKSRIFDIKGNTIISKGTDIYPDNLPKTIGWARIDQPETFFLSEDFKKVGNLNEKLHYLMDREWWMRYLYIFGLQGIKTIDKVLVNFRLHDHSKTMSEKGKFQIEHDTIFYRIAAAGKLPNIQSLIKDNCVINEAIDSEIQSWQNFELIIKSINYYLLKRADEFYYLNNLPSSRDFLKQVNLHWLPHEDRKLHQRLRLRTHLPRSLVHFIKRKNLFSK